MSRVIGKGRYSGAVYPERQPTPPPVPPPTAPAFAFDQNSTSWSHIMGAVNKIIATATITLQEGSSVRIDGSASFLASIAAGRAFLFAGDNTGAQLISLVSQSFTIGLFGTLTYLGLLTGQSAGPLTITLVVNQNSSAGAKLDSAGENVLMLTEIPA